MRTEYVKFNRERLPKFQTETTIVSDQKGRRYVRKRALSPVGKGHVDKLKVAYDLLVSRLDNVKVPRPNQKGDYLVFDYIPGVSMEQMLVRSVIDGDRNGFQSNLEMYAGFIRTFGTELIIDYRPKGGLEQFIDEQDFRNEECLRVANLDLTFDNLIMDQNGERWVTDYEWVFDAPVPLSFILFRSIYVFYLRHSTYASTMMSFEEAMAIVGVDPSKKDRYTKICESFIDYVFGKEKPFIISREHLQPVYHFMEVPSPPGCQNGNRVKTASELYNDIQITNAKMSTLTEDITSKSRELESLTVTLRDTEEKFKLLSEELVATRSTAENLQQNINVMETRISGLEVQLVEKMEMLTRTTREVQTLTDHINAKEIQLGEKDDLLTQFRKDVQSLNERLNVREIEHFQTVEKLSADLMAKQAELMTMSDWAHRMKLRQDFIDSKLLVRNAERFYRLKGEAMDKLRSEGVKEFTRAAMLKAMPGKAKQWMLNDNPVDQVDLIKSVEANDGKVIVVFPIIPWEFRWQRPQQIVSRFAKNGYTVIFVSMSVSAKGRTYKNEMDAGKDVKLGKLSDNIFQIWLSTDGKVNLYHDKLTDKDVGNLEQGLAAILHSIETKRKYYLIQFPGWTKVALSLRKKLGGKIIFDCMDDHSGFSNNTDDAIKMEGRLIKEADMVITTSQKLYDKAKSLTDDVIMVKNGTDFEFFTHLSPNDQLDGISHPIIGYYGAISDWFDAELVEYAAKSHPDWNFVLIGSTVGCDTSRLEKLSNVRLLGEKPYRELPGFLFYFDVCTIPFKVTPLTLATNPVKFYEYLSSGKPMVSVKLPELVPYQELCYLSNTKEEFVEMIGKALSEKGEELKQRRIEFARNNSWDQRYQDIKHGLDNV